MWISSFNDSDAFDQTKVNLNTSVPIIGYETMV